MAKPIKVEIELDEKGAVKSLTNFDQALARLPNTGKSARQAMTELRQEQKQAADAADLLGDRLGVVLPREVRKFISETKMIGPALATAFNASIFLALGAALFEALTNMDKLTDKLVDWSGAMKEAQTQLEKTNSAIVDHNRKLLDLQRSNALIGLTGVGKAQALAGFGQEDLAALKDRLNVYLTAQQALNKVRQETITATNEVGGTTIIPTEAATQAINTLKNIENLIATTRVQINVAEEAMKGFNLQIGDEFQKSAAQAAKAAATFDANMLDFFRARHTPKLLDALKMSPGLWAHGADPAMMQEPDQRLVNFDKIVQDHLKVQAATRSALGTTGLEEFFGKTSELFESVDDTWIKIQDEHRAGYLRMIDSIRDGAGRVFDAMLTSGRSVFASLADFAKSILQTALRNVFQKAAVRLLGPLAKQGGILGAIFGPAGIGATTQSGGTASPTSFGAGLSKSLGIPLQAITAGASSTNSAGSFLQSSKGSMLTAGAGIAGNMMLGSAWASGSKAMGVGGGALTGFSLGSSIGMMAAGPAGAAIGAAIGAAGGALAGLFVGVFGGGAKRRAAEVARRTAIQEGMMFTAGSPLESFGTFGTAGESLVETDLMGNTIVFNIQAVDVDGFRRYMPAIARELNRSMLTGQYQLADNIAWAAGP